MPYKFREIEKRLCKLGFKIVREGKGSHVIFSDGSITFPVPKHGGKEISKGVEKKIIKMVGISEQEFRDLV